ncbi:hypothetical protein [Horticoccus sp. 23ND18S-11]|uniref:hypothetical protein n=1 Tax=Horticoccus sp. 23ND18S-11 TaxID=3391832 RepID=UPI0039C8DEED
MIRPTLNHAWLLLAVALCLRADAQPAVPLAGTSPLETRSDLSRDMVAGIDRYALRALDRSIEARAAFWQRDASTPAAYERSVQPNRERFRRMIGAVDARVPMTGVQLVADTTTSAVLAETARYTVLAVRWPVFAGVHAEGLLLQPKSTPRARVVALADADQTPEMLVGLTPGIAAPSQFARRLAESGCQVLIPTLVDRRDEDSGNARLNRFTNQPHREWIYRQAYELGRHLIGYEVQQVLAAVDWFENENARGPRVATGVAGYGEGGLIAQYAGALDPRIRATWVSGYFDSRQNIWAEPIERNVFGLLREFGDAELASLIVPRSLIFEFSAPPTVTGPPTARPGRSVSAAPGRIAAPVLAAVQREFARAQALVGTTRAGALQLVHGTDATPLAPGSAEALAAFWSALAPDAGPPRAASAPPVPVAALRDAAVRQTRLVRAMEAHTQALLNRAEAKREETFWQKLKPASPGAWREATRDFKEQLWTDVLGRLPAADRPINPRTRRFVETAAWTGYEVVLDVWEDVFAWGYLLLPKDLQPGERRPVVVCQHGLEGLPVDTINENPQERAFGYYKAFAARLAERGFIVFSPHNPYRGRDDFRVLQRKLNPLGASLFSVILAQNDRILDWLVTQPFVDPARIGYYGLSYGGKAAMRLPALLDRFALSICSGDFNEWIRKNASVDLRYGYMFAPEYEIFEFNLGPTFNYAEMAALIAPRPFMVERGHNDGVGVDEWVSYEYAKVRRLYTQLGIPERTAIEYFNGPHTINGIGTFDFLHTHLNWPKRPR